MRKLLSKKFHDVDLQRALDAMYTEMEVEGVIESDIISVSVLPEPSKDSNLVSRSTSILGSRYEIVAIYWANE